MQPDDWKAQLNVVYSTDPNYMPSAEVPEPITLPPERQHLRLTRDRHHRGGKTVTLINGFVGTEDDLAALAKTLKTKCGIGGTAKNGVIVLQGDCRIQVQTILQQMQYNVKNS